MSELGEVLGGVLASLAHARRIADEESSAIAEYYRTNPLLEGMSLPRVRVPEMVLDLPVLIEAYDEGEASVPTPEKEMRETARLEFERAAQAQGVRLPRTVLDQFGRAVAVELGRAQSVGRAKNYTAEHTAKAIDQALSSVVQSDTVTRFSRTQLGEVRAVLRQMALAKALKKEGRRPSLKVDVLTGNVKDQSGAANVARLKIALREEGLEWTVVEQPDGTVTRRLTPE